MKLRKDFRKGRTMVKVNDNYLKLPGSYLFSTIGKKVREYKAANPEKEIISGIMRR